MIHRVRLYFHALRYLHPWQVIGRIWAKVKAASGPPKPPPPPAKLVAKLSPRTPFVSHDPWNTRESLQSGTFCFLNESSDLGKPIGWGAPQMPLLWQFNLHYFNYLHLLGTTEREELCREWIRLNPPGSAISWHPYPTSLRIVNWCKSGISAPDVLESLYLQAAFLFRNLETYVRGNHLLENARALVFAGLHFGGQGEAPLWLERGLEIFRRETPEQVLPDGGYFERSPMYHALMLEAYLDVLNVLPEQHLDRTMLAGAASGMSDFLVSATHPDGCIALLNDSGEEIAPRTADLVAYSKQVLARAPEAKHSFPQTGYFIYEDELLYMIWDGGRIAPDYLPAHAHADVFTFELSVSGEKLVVDSGTFQYAAGEMRDYVRSTAAHNTVCVDRTDQAECWGSFRVARRYAPAGVKAERLGSRIRYEGTFSGYAELIGDNIKHTRIVSIDPHLRELTIDDHITGKGEHLVESWLHLVPGASVIIDGEYATLRYKDVCAEIGATGGRLRTESSWYCPRFGVRFQNTALVLGGSNTLPLHLQYRIRY